ncbi:integrase catalytic domain-containing protein [Trichonephila clavipes]|nr:integrase catalytic domain-containing protein [Trichonephila clavipes]
MNLKGNYGRWRALDEHKKKYGDFLTPLVESCLPEEILMAWERKRNTETDAKGSRTLEHLMTFLRLEVQGEEMVQLAKSGFGTPIRKKDSPTESVKPTKVTTASALASSVKSSVLSEKKICGFISKIEDKRILNELKNKEIILSDLNCKETEIGLLIGADNIGKLLTGNLIEFDSGLTAIETKLGWTHVRNVSIKELWELDVLGITDPLLNENTKENFELTDFKNKMKILPNGRYEVKLPWKCNSENLPSNKELTWKRHLQMMNKLRNGKFFEDYKSVFRQWENLNIIERVPEVELNNECHYLPHRSVIKLDSATTKIRPVFDASAREKGKPSLNDCLYKGVNLIELIPDILDRFRIYPVGIVADIEKAFLMLSVAPKDRDYLRFFSHAMKNN